MDAATESETRRAEDPLTLPSGLLDVDMPLASFHDLLRDSQLSLPWFDFSSVDDVPSHPERPGARENTACGNPKGPCVDLATGLLGSMHPGSHSCVLGVAGQIGDRRLQPSHEADAVLDMNRLALTTVRSILQCPCHRVPQVLLLITAVCSQIGASYRQIASMYSQRGKKEVDSAVLFSSGATGDAHRRDFFIGSHRLSQDVEAAVIRQVLLGMLRELKLVIGAIARNTGQSPATDDPRSEMTLSGMRARMVAFLHTQAHALTSALDHLGSDFAVALSPVSRD